MIRARALIFLLVAPGACASMPDAPTARPAPIVEAIAVISAEVR